MAGTKAVESVKDGIVTVEKGMELPHKHKNAETDSRLREDVSAFLCKLRRMRQTPFLYRNAKEVRVKFTI